MRFARPLIPGRLERRYKRFLADVTLEDGQLVTAHCANPGAMLGVADPGATVWLEPNDDPKRKLNYSWKLTELEGDNLAGIDTAVPNKIVAEALAAGAIPAVADYQTIRAEVRYGERSRVDFLATGPDLPDCYLEVKNVHLRRSGTLAEFPDSVTARGAKHMVELAEMVRAGHRAIVLYVLQRDDCDHMTLAADLDPKYAEATLAARAAGVELICHGTRLSREEIVLTGPVPVDIPA